MNCAARWPESACQILQERLESGRTDGAQRHLEKLGAEIDHMDGLIDKTLSLSKLDLQEPAQRNDEVIIDALFAEAVTKHQPLASDKSITVSHHPTGAPPYRCNRENMQIVLDNVLSNAIKYSPEGASISVTGKWDGETITLCVSNPYRHISGPELETLFIPFRRLGYDEVEGNGLGLAFARKIVEDHGGTITATSDKTAFRMTVVLPVQDA